MPSVTIKQFRGLDTRRVSTVADAKTLIRGVNVEITPAGGIRSRPGIRKIAQLHEETAGLFSSNGLLLTAAIAGSLEVANAQSPHVRSVFLGGFDPGELVDVRDTEVIGQDVTARGLPYLIVERSDGTFEHHYIDTEPETPGATVETKVEVPFQPDPTLVKLRSRLWTSSNLFGSVYGNAIQGGPRDWETPQDAVDFPVSRHVQGDRTVVAVSYYRSLLAVFFEDSIQLWGLDEDPANISIAEVLNGPGTQHPRSVVNVLGDLFYLGRSGFRRLEGSIAEGERRESQEALNRIDPTIIEAIAVDGVRPISIWSQARSQYLCAVGSTVYVFTYVPSDKIFGWAQWNLPVAVDGFLELDGDLYFRGADDGVYVFDPEEDNDLGTRFTWDVKTQFLGKGEEAKLWQFLDVSVAMQGTARISAFAVPEAPDESDDLGEYSGVTSAYERISIFAASSALALGFTGTGFWQLDGFALRLNQLRT